ncbi:hypothetical protein M0811_00909 [Anaeramoeba ignava]|uniref:LRRK2 ARM repeat domain-containing protein n=1 Tax=Anaeramoeba ignava TaxID=1746090 RepID=A0A9Q0LM41_ANAIG|nr:hypothetical protein M0811_00909 [Anaeramoeba ignava]
MDIHTTLRDLQEKLQKLEEKFEQIDKKFENRFEKIEEEIYKLKISPIKEYDNQFEKQETIQIQNQIEVTNQRTTPKTETDNPEEIEAKNFLQKFRDGEYQENNLESDIDQIVKWLLLFPLSVDIQENGCFFFNKFAEKNQNPQFRYKDNMIDSIIKAMDTFPSNSQIQFQGGKFLLNLPFPNQESKDQIRKSKGIPSIIKTMNNFPNEEDIQIKGCITLMKISEDNLNNAVQIRANKGIETIIKTMKNSTNKEIEFLGIQILKNLSEDNESKTIIGSLQGIELLFNLSKAFPNDENFQLIIIQTLERISQSHRNNLSLIDQFHGVERIITIMGNFPKIYEIHYSGCLILHGIYTFNIRGIDSSGTNQVIEQIILSMNTFPNQDELQIEGCRALRKLSTNNFENQNEIRRHSGIKIIINAINTFPSNKEIQKTGISTLNFLSNNNQENQKEIVLLNGFEVIMRILNNFFTDLQTRKWCLQMFQSFIDLYSKFQTKI